MGRSRSRGYRRLCSMGTVRRVMCLMVLVALLYMTFATRPHTHDQDERVIQHRAEEREKYVRARESGQSIRSSQPPTAHRPVRKIEVKPFHTELKERVVKSTENEVKAPIEDSPPPVKAPEEYAHPEDAFMAAAPYTSLTDRIWKTVPKNLWGPPAEDAAALAKVIPCDRYTVPFKRDADRACVQALTDMNRWHKLRAVPQGFDERTIKFKVTVGAAGEDEGPHVEAILKVPQRLYPTEPYSEVMSHHSDRVLGLGRVPPTGLVCVPLDWLVVSALETGAKMQLVQQFARDSGVSDYTDWLRKDFIQFAVSGRHGVADSFEGGGSAFAAHMDASDYDKWMATHGGKAVAEKAAQLRRSGPLQGTDKNTCVHASVQLFVAGVGHLLSSHYAIPYRSHDPSWHKYFAPAVEYPAPPDLTIPLLHISQLVTFDFILGNNDRSPNKNNFVAGGCKHRCPSGPDHPGPPDFVYLDQGLTFHSSHDNPLAQVGAHDPADPKHSSFCVFYAPLIQSIRRITNSGVPFSARLKKATPPVAYAHIGDARVKAADGRLEAVVKQVDHCVERWGLNIALRV